MKNHHKPDPVSIDAVLYDVDGTFYSLRWMRLIMAFHLFRAFLINPFRMPRTLRIISAFRQAQEHLRYEGGDLETDQIDQLTWTASKLQMDVRDIKPVITLWMEEKPLAFMRRIANLNVIEMIRILYRAKIRQGVYSDYPALNKIDCLGLWDMLDVIVCSWDDYVMRFKPAPDGFLAAAEKLEVDPEKVIYIGDRTDADGTGARAAGMHFIHVKKINRKVVRQLRENPEKALAMIVQQEETLND